MYTNQPDPRRVRVDIGMGYVSMTLSMQSYRLGMTGKVLQNHGSGGRISAIIAMMSPRLKMED